ncbi:MAG: Stp1/IreP family PP2C-type Ser/Thr phosphatase [Firmicutes bacterium]|nr:Stp1/IreP family PP2C-type Ser/Thr phosphatase [Bacillota bacterium]
MKLGVRSDIGRVREVNEDSYFVSESLLVVADGMGGHQAGEVASQIACQTMKDRLPVWSGDPEGWLNEAIHYANAKVYELSLSNPQRRGMGTTLTAAALTDGYIYLGHVGDSRAYIESHGVLKRVTDDHSIVAELVRSGSLTEEEARFHPHRNIITKALGVEPVLIPDLLKVEIGKDDRVILCTDGLTGMVSDGEILGALKRIEDPQELADFLVDLANERGGHDNITVVIARV